MRDVDLHDVGQFVTLLISRLFRAQQTPFSLDHLVIWNSPVGSAGDYSSMAPYGFWGVWTVEVQKQGRAPENRSGSGG